MKKILKGAAGAALLAILWPLSGRAQGYPISGGVNMPGLQSLFGSGIAGTTETLPGLIVTIVYILLFFSFSVAVLFLIIGGFWYITSAGNTETAEKGRNAIVNSIIGIVVIILSYAIIRVIVNTLSGSGFLFSN